MKRIVGFGLAILAIAALLGTLTVQAPIQRQDPLRNNNFRVEIDGVTVASFSECSGIGSESEIIEYRAGDDLTTHKLPGALKWPNLVLKRGVSSNMELWTWRQNIVNGQVDRRSISVVILDGSGGEAARFNFVNAWPSRISLGSLNASGNDILIEEIEIAHEGMVRVK